MKTVGFLLMLLSVGLFVLGCGGQQKAAKEKGGEAVVVEEVEVKETVVPAAGEAAKEAEKPAAKEAEKPVDKPAVPGEETKAETDQK